MWVLAISVKEFLTHAKLQMAKGVETRKAFQFQSSNKVINAIIYASMLQK